MKSALIVVSLSAFVKNVAGWGQLGHETVGYIAQEFLAPKALAFVQSSLAGSFSGSLGPAAPWADSVRPTKPYSWTEPFHFIDANDSPLQGQCSVDQTRDCANGNCLLSAIANYTARVVDTSLGADQQTEALKFLDHFFGDIGQPLHNEAYKVGGNDISATCAGSSTNLHASWDTGMVVQHIKQNHGGTSQQYATDLVAQIKTGSFQSQAASWISCSSPTSISSRDVSDTTPIDPTTDDTTIVDPSSDPSLDSSADSSSDPSSDPSTASSDPSSDPSSNPSSDPSTDPTTDPSTDPSTASSDPSTDPSTDPTDPNADPNAASDPSTDPSTASGASSDSGSGLDSLRTTRKPKPTSTFKPSPTSTPAPNPNPGPVTPLACPLVWSQESNAFDCSDVFNFQSGQDLCTSSYFTSAVPIIDLQLAKQGYRLAAWLNVLFDGSTNL